MSKVSLINGHIDGAETCVICGRDIPEGSQVCVICGKTEPRDLVEVVRCKDCKHANELVGFERQLYVAGCVACKQIHQNSERIVMLATDFCSYGERRGKEE